MSGLGTLSGLGELAAPATKKDLQDLEDALGVLIPANLRSSLLIHNGNISVDGYKYLSCPEILQNWKSMTNLSDQGIFADVEVVYSKHDVFENIWWHRRWVPFSADSCGNLLCVDTDPGPQGCIGQVLHWETNEGPSTTKFSSFAEWLGQHRNELLSGKFKIDDDGLIERNRAS